jgi:tripartite-type tricarboxylate transporter receptor subunit TctC
MVATAAFLATPALNAQTLPKGTVRIVVGFPAGGGTDVLARILADRLRPLWDTSIIVDNRVGAAGIIAADHVSKQPGDGTTLLMAHINTHGIASGLYPKLKYDAERDFTPIALVGATPQMVICGSNQPFKTLPELVEYCKKNPGKVTCGSAGQGSAQHLALEMFKARAGIDVLHVPYKGSAQLIPDLMAGHVQFCFEGMTTATPHIASGKVVALAQTKLKRSPSHQNIATVAEQGYPNFNASIWFGVVGPAKMSGEMVKRMNDDINKVLRMPDVMERLKQAGAEDGGGSAERFDEFMKEERRKWSQLIRERKITADS